MTATFTVFLSEGRSIEVPVISLPSIVIFSRALIVALDALGIDPDFSYVVALWGPVLASAAVVELVSLRSVFPMSSAVYSRERMRREISPLALLVRARSVVRPLARLGR